jgi:hypothetical protein
MNYDLTSIADLDSPAFYAEGRNNPTPLYPGKESRIVLSGDELQTVWIHATVTDLAPDEYALQLHGPLNRDDDEELALMYNRSAPSILTPVGPTTAIPVAPDEQRTLRLSLCTETEVPRTFYVTRERSWDPDDEPLQDNPESIAYVLIPRPAIKDIKLLIEPRSLLLQSWQQRSKFSLLLENLSFETTNVTIELQNRTKRTVASIQPISIQVLPRRRYEWTIDLPLEGLRLPLELVAVATSHLPAMGSMDIASDPILIERRKFPGLALVGVATVLTIFALLWLVRIPIMSALAESHLRAPTLTTPSLPSPSHPLFVPRNIAPEASIQEPSALPRPSAVGSQAVAVPALRSFGERASEPELAALPIPSQPSSVLRNSNHAALQLHPMVSAVAHFNEQDDTGARHALELLSISDQKSALAACQETGSLRVQTREDDTQKPANFLLSITPSIACNLQVYQIRDQEAPTPLLGQDDILFPVEHEMLPQLRRMNAGEQLEIPLSTGETQRLTFLIVARSAALGTLDTDPIHQVTADLSERQPSNGWMLSSAVRCKVDRKKEE